MKGKATMPEVRGYYDTNIVRDYTAGVWNAVRTGSFADAMESLRRHVSAYPTLAPDAMEAVENISTLAEFRELRAGMKSERRGVFAGEDFTRKYGAVLMPKRMVEMSLLAERFQCPEGLAAIRLFEELWSKEATP